MKYTLSPDVLTANLQGESVLLDMHAKDYYRLNETAACVWQRLATGATAADLVERVCAEFDIDESAAVIAVDQLLRELFERGLVVGHL